MHSNRKGDVMLKYVLKRLGYILVTLWVIVTCTFFMMKNLPGTPFDAERFSIMTPQQQERVLEMYGLNDSLPMQYVKYIKNMLKGDLGTSFTYVNQDVPKAKISSLFTLTIKYTIKSKNDFFFLTPSFFITSPLLFSL